MADTLEKEFIKMIEEVTKEVTEEVVQESALESVNELNQTMKTLKEDSKELIADISQAKGMYNHVAEHSQQSLERFDQHIDTWQEQQQTLLDSVNKRNRDMMEQISHIEERQKEHGNALKRIQLAQNEQKRLEQDRMEKNNEQFQKLQIDSKNNKEELQQNLIGHTVFLQDKIKTLRYLLSLNLVCAVIIIVYLFRHNIHGILSLIGG